MTTHTSHIALSALDAREADFDDAQLDAASHLLRQIPRDQALGLRLIALAQACAGAHMAQAALNLGQSASRSTEVTAPEIDELVGRSQAAALAARLAEWMASREGAGT